MSASERDATGTLPARTEWVEESTRGETPADPSWNYYSDTMRTWTATPDAQVERQEQYGDADAQGHFAGPETHELTVEYDLQEWLVDGSGDPQDAAGYAFLRDSNNRLYGTHTAVKRVEKGSGAGTAGNGRRIYTVAKGATPDATLEFDPSDNLPVGVELEYTAEKIRMYVIDQPGTDETLTVSSTDSGDTTQTLTIESDDAATTEDVSLDGTTDVTTTESFSSIDAVELDSPAEGNVTVEDGDGNVLVEVKGANEYAEDDGDIDGDLGVPALGSGSHASDIGSDYEHFIGDTVERPSGSAFSLQGTEAQIHEASLSVDNNIDEDPNYGGLQQDVTEGNRNIEFEADVGGPKPRFDSIMEHLTNTAHDIVWIPNPSGTRQLTLTDATITDAGEDTEETDQVRVVTSNTFEALGLTITG
jgi:hypothetical protein